MAQTWRLVDALLLFLLFLFPLMFLLGRSEGTLDRATFLFWLLLILPVLILPWFWRGVDPEGRCGSACSRHHIVTCGSRRRASRRDGGRADPSLGG
jgi:hypothetical protein